MFSQTYILRTQFIAVSARALCLTLYILHYFIGICANSEFSYSLCLFCAFERVFIEPISV